MQIAYAVSSGQEVASVGDTVLTVNSEDADRGSAELAFNVPADSDIVYAGEYIGSVMFTVST